jgi:hypothetical protein
LTKTDLDLDLDTFLNILKRTAPTVRKIEFSGTIIATRKDALSGVHTEGYARRNKWTEGFELLLNMPHLQRLMG